jgi:hypothetical protein
MKTPGPQSFAHDLFGKPLHARIKCGQAFSGSCARIGVTREKMPRAPHRSQETPISSVTFLGNIWG